MSLLLTNCDSWTQQVQANALSRIYAVCTQSRNQTTGNGYMNDERVGSD